MYNKGWRSSHNQNWPKKTTVFLESTRTAQKFKQTVVKCIYANVDGIFNKREEFRLLLSQERPSLVSLVETKLNNDINNSELFDTDMYEIYRKDRRNQNAPGGGVALLVKKDLISSENNVKFLNYHLYEEAVWCEVNLDGKNILIGTVYRPPNSSREANDLLCDLISLSDRYDKESQVLICGDLHYNETCW